MFLKNLCVPCACCAGGVSKVQRFEDVLQQCACQRNRGSIAVLQTGGQSVIYKTIQRLVVSLKQKKEIEEIRLHENYTN